MGALVSSGKGKLQPVRKSRSIPPTAIYGTIINLIPISHMKVTSQRVALDKEAFQLIDESPLRIRQINIQHYHFKPYI